ncbi:MAG: hypothetical protein ACYDG3_14520 [Bacillati bacterium]
MGCEEMYNIMLKRVQHVGISDASKRAEKGIEDLSAYIQYGRIYDDLVANKDRLIAECEAAQGNERPLMLLTLGE